MHHDATPKSGGYVGGDRKIDPLVRRRVRWVDGWVDLIDTHSSWQDLNAPAEPPLPYQIKIKCKQDKKRQYRLVLVIHIHQMNELLRGEGVD